MAVVCNPDNGYDGCQWMHKLYPWTRFIRIYKTSIVSTVVGLTVKAVQVYSCLHLHGWHGRFLAMILIIKRQHAVYRTVPSWLRMGTCGSILHNRQNLLVQGCDGTSANKSDGDSLLNFAPCFAPFLWIRSQQIREKRRKILFVGSTEYSDESV